VLIRCLIRVIAVVAISSCIAHVEPARGERPAASDWVRTTDGWEPSIVLALRQQTAGAPGLHPVLVASFQLIASLLFLLAYPPACTLVAKGQARSASSRGTVAARHC